MGDEKSLARRVSAFSVIGIVLTILGGWFVEWTTLIGWVPIVANGVQAFVSIILNFVLNNTFTWPDRKGTTTRTKAIRFAKVKAFTLGYNIMLFPLGQLLYPVAVIIVVSYLPILKPVLKLFPYNIFAYYFSTSVIMAFNYFAGDRYIYSAAEPKPSVLFEFFKRKVRK